MLESDAEANSPRASLLAPFVVSHGYAVRTSSHGPSEAAGRSCFGPSLAVSEAPDDLAGNVIACSAGCVHVLPSNKPSFGFGRYQSCSPFRTGHGLAVGIGQNAEVQMVTWSFGRAALRRIQELAVCSRALLRAAAWDDWYLCEKKDVEASEPRGEWKTPPGRPS